VETIGVLERLFVQKGLSPRQIARRHPSLGLSAADIADRLMAAGLEVDGNVKPGLTPSSRAICLKRGVEI
jgi:hypothetical protein